MTYLIKSTLILIVVTLLSSCSTKEEKVLVFSKTDDDYKYDGIVEIREDGPDRKIIGQRKLQYFHPTKRRNYYYEH